jgi:MoaA/NifB/PqqE/SkfB family radical SAM enzyme
MALVVVCRVLTACNLACGFCAFDRRLPIARSTLGEARLTRLIDLLAAQAGRPPLLSWLGGEPLLWRDWPRWSARARAHGLRVSATSNGSTRGSAAARGAVLEHLDELTLSLDAADARHDGLRGWPGGAARVLAALRALARERAHSDAPLRLRANAVLMRSTIGDFAVLCSALVDAGVDEICFNLLGGRDRPEFHARESVLPAQFAAFLRVLPALRARLEAQGVRLVGDAQYQARLQAAISGLPWPVADCDPGREFLFVDEHGRVAPCAFTGAEYAVDLLDVDSLSALPAQFRAARRARCASACSDCPSTQVSGKFAPGVDLRIDRAQPRARDGVT